MKMSRVLSSVLALSAFMAPSIFSPMSATPYYGRGIGTCQDARKNNDLNSRCFDKNNEYARYENFRDWLNGKESNELWPGME